MINQPSLDGSPLTEHWGTRTDGLERSSSTRRRWSWIGVWREIGHAIRLPFVSRLRGGVVRSLGLTNERVLEVGVGTGAGLRHYPRTCEVIGTESDADCLRKARRRLARDTLDHVAGLYRTPASILRFADNSFDTVAAFFVFTHKARPSRILNEIVRVVRPGGRVVVVNAFNRTGHHQAPANMPRGLVARTIPMLSSFWRKAGALPPKLLCKHRDLEFVSQRRLAPFGLLTVSEFAKRSA